MDELTGGPDLALWTAADGSVLDLTRLLAPDTSGLDAPPVELMTAPRLSASGSSRIGRRFSERAMTWTLLLEDPPSTVAIVRSVAAALLQGGSLSITVDGETRELRDVEYRGGLEGVWNLTAGAVGSHARVMSPQMVALDPWWYGAGDVAVLSTDAPTLFDDPAVGFDDPATLMDGSAASPIVVSGNHAASPVTTITGPFTTLAVGIAGGQSFQLAAALAAGDVVTVDTRPGRRGPRLNAGPIDWSLLTPVSRLFELPLGGSVLLAQATGTTGASQVSVAWDERHLTP